MNKVLSFLKQRMIRIVLAILLFAVELFLMIGPTSWAGVDKENWLTGEGAWNVFMQEDTVLTQQFIPEHNYVQRISVLFQNNGYQLRGGDVQFIIEDKNGKEIYYTELPYERVTFGSYTDFEVDTKLVAGEVYSLNIKCLPSESGEYASISVCSTDYYMPENKTLIHGDAVSDVQLVSRYTYERALTKEIYLKVIMIAGLTALIVATGIPKNKKLRNIVAIILFLVTPVVLGRQLEFISLELNESIFIPYSIHWNVGIMYLFEVIVLLCTMSVRFSVIFSNLILTIIYSADHFVRIYRAAPLRFADLTAAGTAMKVVGNYDLTPNSNMAISWMILVFVIIVIMLSRNKNVSLKEHGKQTVIRKVVVHVISFAAGICLSLYSGYILLSTDFLERNGFVTVHGVHKTIMYQFNGYLISACLDYKSNKVTEPEGYSKDAAETLLQEYEEKTDSQIAKEDMPHIILIMNESYSDLRVLGDLQISEENMEFFYSLEQNTIRGQSHVSVIGGGTANSEFEVFTGCSMGLFPSHYYPYQQAIKGPTDSMVSDLMELGYTSYSIHPEDADNWSRKQIYQYLGFENQYWIEDFSGMEYIHQGYSDRATYQKIQELFENREDDEKMFIFDLTMQNHGGYGDGDGYNSVKSLNSPSAEADNYLSLIKESDKALEELITYFSEQDEKVIICMFGDHQPQFSDSGFYDTIFNQTEGLGGIDRIINKYITQFVIWANYDIPENADMNISLNYLGVLLQDTAGLPLSPYFGFLKEQMEANPVITANGYLDENGVFCEWSGNKIEFPEYRILQHHIIYGDK